jgi:hypothetical protein
VTQVTPEGEATDASAFVFAGEITSDNDIGVRALAKWIVSGKFPAADGNLNGRNFWLRANYRKWQADVLAGRYRRESNLSRKPRAAALVVHPTS